MKTKTILELIEELKKLDRVYLTPKEHKQYFSIMKELDKRNHEGLEKWLDSAQVKNQKPTDNINEYLLP